MIVVADTTPLNYLIQLGRVELLPLLYRRVLILAAVQSELLHPRAPAPVREWITAAPSWLEVVPTLWPPDPGLAQLDEGEAEAIRLAEEVQADRLVLDDALGRDVARARGLQVIGTLAILREASQRGLLDIRAELQQLRLLGFHVAQQIVDAVLGSEAATHRISDDLDVA